MKNKILRERLLQGKTSNTREFIASLDDVEAGLLVYEDWERPDGFIYEIFVLRDARKRGIGAWVLSQAELVAARLGRTSISLTARSLYQDELSDEELIAWYERKGYVQSAVERNALGKSLSLPSHDSAARARVRCSHTFSECAPRGAMCSGLINLGRGQLMFSHSLGQKGGSSGSGAGTGAGLNAGGGSSGQ
ncbi:MAG: GNAT family N-acetyltransferase [Pseudomonas sp.]